MSESAFFIAIVPPEKIRNEITQLKILMAERFNSKHALRSPPHITLHMPFKWKAQKIERLTAVMDKLNEGMNPFTIELKGFSFFEPRVVYVDAVENKELFDFQKASADMVRRELKLDNANYKNRGFRPHVTIGFRDLRKPQFFEARDYFKDREFHAAFQVRQAQLLRHDGARWEIFS